MDEEMKTLKEEFDKLTAYLQEHMPPKRLEKIMFHQKKLLKNVQKRTWDVRNMEGKQFKNAIKLRERSIYDLRDSIRRSGRLIQVSGFGWATGSP